MWRQNRKDVGADYTTRADAAFTPRGCVENNHLKLMSGDKTTTV